MAEWPQYSPERTDEQLANHIGVAQLLCFLAELERRLEMLEAAERYGTMLGQGLGPSQKN